MSSKTRACMQRAPNSVAFRTPSHDVGGCGGFHRRSPTGGAANGMPLKTRTLDEATVVPSTAPAFVFTGSAVATAAVRRITTPDTDRRKPKVNEHGRHSSCGRPPVTPVGVTDGREASGVTDSRGRGGHGSTRNHTDLSNLPFPDLRHGSTRSTRIFCNSLD